MMKIIIALLLVVAAAVCVHAGVSWKAEIFVAEPIPQSNETIANFPYFVNE